MCFWGWCFVDSNQNLDNTRKDHMLRSMVNIPKDDVFVPSRVAFCVSCARCSTDNVD